MVTGVSTGTGDDHGDARDPVRAERSATVDGDVRGPRWSAPWAWAFGNEQFALIPVGSFQMGSTNGRTTNSRSTR